MSDIVERLRTLNSRSLYGELLEIATEAADEIERCYGAIADLQAEVRRKSEEIERLSKLEGIWEDTANRDKLTELNRQDLLRELKSTEEFMRRAEPGPRSR